METVFCSVYPICRLGGCLLMALIVWVDASFWACEGIMFLCWAFVWKFLANREPPP